VIGAGIIACMTTLPDRPFMPPASARSRASNLFVRAAMVELLRFAQRGIPLFQDEVLERYFPRACTYKSAGNVRFWG
jgi:hypothetical protein